MKKKATLLLGLAPLFIALFGFTRPLPPQDSTHAVMHHIPFNVMVHPPPTAQQLVGQQVAMQQDRTFFLNRFMHSNAGQIDTSTHSLNVVHPQDSAGVRSILDAFKRFPKRDKELFTAFENNDGTGRAITFIISSDSDVDSAHKALVAAFDKAIDKRVTERDGLRSKIYALGLWITALAAIGAFLTAAFGGKGTRTVIIVAAAITLATSVLGYISKDRSDRFSEVTKTIDTINGLESDYYQHRGEHAADPKNMLVYIEGVSEALNRADRENA